MKTLSTPLVITGIRSKVDRSLGLTCSSPELSTEERALFMELQGLNLEAIFRPTEEKSELQEVKGDMQGKSPSTRLRNVIFVFWKQKGEQGEFESFYKQKMEGFIEKVKSLIE